MLDSQSPQPLYLQLAELLRQEIAEGKYPVESKIPSEPFLVKHYGIGRPTVRQATEVLVREGLLERRRGAGTFVTPPKQALAVFSLSGTGFALKQANNDVTVKLLKAPERLQGDNIPQRLASTEVFYLRRLNFVSDEPVMLEDLYLDAKVFPHFVAQYQPEQALSQLTAQHYGLSVSKAEQHFGIAGANAQVAEMLRVKSGTPLLHVTRLLGLGRHKQAVMSVMHCHSERYEFTQTIDMP